MAKRLKLGLSIILLMGSSACLHAMETRSTAHKREQRATSALHSVKTIITRSSRAHNLKQIGRDVLAKEEELLTGPFEKLRIQSEDPLPNHQNNATALTGDQAHEAMTRNDRALVSFISTNQTVQVSNEDAEPSIAAVAFLLFRLSTLPIKKGFSL